ncbi:hypothetical protein FIBSPDRAFT_894530 [Athelia psychrophila]|uniref:Uncharacterized protein n=1 Tax=Athelia psychrophila TaxID=1759441 RepID=A0A166FSX9_9AGAM|nr:hypothetical protein FIBSPDRAFT_894530 [Fibularhizoctonia sp. CBS 109695]
MRKTSWAHYLGVVAVLGAQKPMSKNGWLGKRLPRSRKQKSDNPIISSCHNFYHNHRDGLAGTNRSGHMPRWHKCLSDEYQTDANMWSELIPSVLAAHPNSLDLSERGPPNIPRGARGHTYFGTPALQTPRLVVSVLSQDTGDFAKPFSFVSNISITLSIGLVNSSLFSGVLKRFLFGALKMELPLSFSYSLLIMGTGLQCRWGTIAHRMRAFVVPAGCGTLALCIRPLIAPSGRGTFALRMWPFICTFGTGEPSHLAYGHSSRLRDG